MGEGLNLTATEDALRRRNKSSLKQIASKYPGLGLKVDFERQLGESKKDLSGARELANVAILEAKEDLSELHVYLAGKVRTLARIRLIAAIATTLSSASVVALIVGQERGQLFAASVTLAATLIGLSLVYVEDFSGGDGSLKQLRDKMVDETRNLTTLAGELRLAEKLKDDEGVVEVLRKTNIIFGEVQFVRAKVGLPV